MALGAVVILRWAAWRSGAIESVALGGLFGLALGAIALAGGWRPRPWAGRGSAIRSVTVGAGGGAFLVASVLLGPHDLGEAWMAGSPLVPWAAATLLVAGAEEVLVRGALFDAIAPALGPAAAVAATSMVFALMHAPAYGWQAVPLDLGVGFVLAGLRLVSGGVAAPALAHAVADLAVAWL